MQLSCIMPGCDGVLDIDKKFPLSQVELQGENLENLRNLTTEGNLDYGFIKVKYSCGHDVRKAICEDGDIKSVIMDK